MGGKQSARHNYRQVFVTLVRNLGPFVLMLIDPESRSRRQDGNPVIGRKNLEWVLNGHPDAAPLFQ
jgi:hypothetical protein